MKKGKLIVIEGTDCSGKETQSNLLIEELKKNNIPVKKFSFPNYESPTGKIVGGPYLGKEHIGEGFFNEGAANVDPMVASLYFAADRRYNINKITSELEKGVNIVVDRYVDSNLAHQTSKILNPKKQKDIIKFLETLEYDFLKLPRADITIFLYMPVEYSKQLKQNRKEKPDQHESDEVYLLNSERVYLNLCKKHKYIKVDCVSDGKIKTIEEIKKEVFEKVYNKV